MKSEVLKFWETALWWIAVLALVIPLFVVPHIVMGIVFVKLVVFQILVVLLLAIYFVLWGLDPNKYKPKFTWLSISVLLFAGVLIISTIFSLQPFSSFWGSAFRYNGLFSYLHYFVYFFVLSWAIHGKEQWLKLLRIAIYISLAVVVYGIAQYCRFPFMPELDGIRLVATLSNPLTLAQYLLLLFFPTLIYGLKTSYKKLRWLLFSIATLQFVTILLTGARGALIAFVVGVVFFAIYYAWIYYKPLFQKTLIISLGCFLILSLLVVGSGQLFKSDNYFLNRIISINLANSTVQSRLNAWKIAWNASFDRPLTGYGLDNFDVAFDKHYQPFAEKFSNSETWFDRAHNSFLDYLVMAGILGVLAYILLLIIALWRSFKISINNKNNWKKHLAVSLSVTLIVYIIFNLSAFDAGSVYVVFFFLLAMLNSFDIKKRIVFVSKTSLFSWLLYLLAIISSVCLLSIHYKHITADRIAGHAIAAFYKKDFTGSLELVNESLNYNTFINLAVGNRLIQAGKDLSVVPEVTSYKDILMTIGDIFEKIIENSENGKYYAVLGDYYGQLVSIDPLMLERMNQALDQSALLAPNRPFLYLNWGSVLTTGTDQYKEAIEKCKIAIDIYPEFPLAYFWLGASQIADKQLEAGDLSIKKAVELGINLESNDALSILATVLEKAGEYNQAADVYHKLVANFGTKSSEPYYAALSFYYRIGWYQQAYDLASIYLNRYPDDEVVLNLVSKIKIKAPYVK